MKNSKLVVLNCISSIKNLLKIDLSYSEIQKQIKKTTISEKKMNFANSKFSKNEDYRFPYTQEDAIAIIGCCQYFTNTYELLLNTYLPGDLNLHSSRESLQNETKEPILEWLFDNIDDENFKNSKFANSNLDQKSYFKTLKIAEWSYANFIVSAIFFYLENIYGSYLEKKIFSPSKPFLELKTFSSSIALFFLHKTYGKSLFNTLQGTNVFTLYPEYWLSAFILNLQSTGTTSFKSYEFQDKLYFYKKIQKHCSGNLNFFQIAFYLKSFNNFIPTLVLSEVYKYCYRTKTVHILYYVLKKYQNSFNFNLTEKEKENEDYSLTKQLENELGDQLNTIFNFNEFSLFKNFKKFLKNNKMLLLFFGLVITPQFPNEVILSLSFSRKLPINPTPSKNILPAQIKESRKQFFQRKKESIVKNNPNTNWETNLQKSGIKTELVSFSQTSKDTFPIAIMEEPKLYTLLAKSGSFSRLEKEKMAASKHMKEKLKQTGENYKEVLPTDIDHMVAKCLNDLYEGDRNLAACVMSTSPLNRCRHYSQQGQSISQRIDELQDFRFSEFAYSTIEAFNIGMISYAEKNSSYLKHLEFLDNANLLEPTIKSYFENIPLGVEELRRFSLSFGFNNDHVAIKVTFIMNHILLRLKKMPEIIKELSNYNKISSKFYLEYLIKTISEHVFTLENMLKSVLSELNLLKTNQYCVHVENELERAIQHIYTELKYSIKKYENCMIKFNLEKVSSQEFLSLQKLITQLLLSPSSDILTPKIKYSLSEFNDDPKLRDYNIGNFGSNKQLQNLTISRNKDSTFSQNIDMTNYTQNIQKNNLEEKSLNVQPTSSSQEDVVYAVPAIGGETEAIDSGNLNAPIETLDIEDFQPESGIDI